MLWGKSTKRSSGSEIRKEEEASIQDEIIEIENALKQAKERNKFHWSEYEYYDSGDIWDYRGIIR